MNDNFDAGINKNGSCADSSSYLQAVSEAASLLLTVNDLGNIDDTLLSSLEIVGRAADADRVHLWRDEHYPNEMVLKRLYTWESEAGKSSPKVPDDVISPFSAFPIWREKFHKGESVGGAVSSLSPDEQEFFGAFGIKTLYLIPLLNGKSFWGLVGIEDCRKERTYTGDEITVLKSVSLMVASAINHHRMVYELMATNEQADAASKTKNAFLSNMSHEIRTPLNAIVGMTVVGRDAESIDDKNHALTKIGDASSHLLEIISNVLDMARIEEGKMELVPVEFSFPEMVEKAISAVRPLADEKNQTVEIDIDRTIPRHVIGDNLRMSQLISNLMSNAVKFTPIYGRICLDIIKIVETDEHLKLQIVVKDNGIGISEDQQSKLFMPFEQAQGALNRDYSGTGLGLPISKRIVELMDGHIWVESEPNRGTTVYLTIQLAKSSTGNGQEDEDRDPDKRGRDSDSPVDDGEFKGKRLLIVEDIEINREIIIALLKKSELIIECAEDGQVAVDMVMFNVEKYDIIFMDLQMPNMGGLEATKRIRQLPERKRGRLPIIAMTANVLSDDIKACLDAGMDEHLSKPLDIDKVLGVLRKYLS